MKLVAVGLLSAYLLAVAIAVARAAPMPRGWHAPGWFLRDATCLHDHEGAWNDETGNGYSGGLQFLESTWQSVGGVGRPSQFSPREQIYRCWLVYLRDGNSFREWGTAGMCGLR